MKKVLVALVCTFGAVACGESRPAESPATTTSVTTETTTVRTPASPGVTSTAPSTAPRTTAVNPADGLDTTRPLHDESMTGTTSTTGATGTAPATTGTGTAAPSSSDNAGVADHTKDATNTKINDRDRHGALTPMDQGGGGDRTITAAIRRAVVADKALSFTAKNVKIITVGGKVTLRGPVKSDEEKSSIEAKAKAAPGVTDVDNQLEVKK